MENKDEKQNGILESGKKKTKNKFKKQILKISIQILVPLLTIAILASLVLGIFSSVGNAIQDAIDAIGGAFYKTDSEGAIVVTDEQVDNIINSISNLGVSIDGLKLMGDVDYSNADVQAENQKALRRYIKEFYEAQAMGETINTNPNWVEEHILNGGKPYGTVYLHRISPGEEVKATDSNQLTYIPYEEMVNRQASGDKTITKNFSINDNGELVIASWTTIKEEKDGKLVSEDTSVNLINIDYKNVISQYTTSMNFFVYLTMITENPEFVSAVTDLVKNSEIRIAALDTSNTSVEVETYTYTENTKTKTKKETETYDAWDTNREYPHTAYVLEESRSTKDKKEVTTTTVTSLVPNLKVLYVKTWFCEQTITYDFNEQDTANQNTTKYDDQEEPELNTEGSVSWKTNQTIKFENSTNVQEYKEATRSDVTDRSGDKGSQGILDKNNNGKVDEDEIVDENSTFIGLLDNSFKIPNSTRYSKPGVNLVSGARIFFYLLQKDSKLQNLELYMRYVLYKYTGNDYGVTEFNFSIFNAKKFRTVGGYVYEGTPEEKVWFTLRANGFSEYAVAGVMGNIQVESGFNPGIIESGNGIGFGLCQWSYGRRTQLENYAKSKGKEASDIDTQIEFLLTEITPGADGPAQGYANYQLLYYRGYNGDMWENATSPEDAAEAFCWSYERPGTPNIKDRESAARSYYEEFTGLMPQDQSPSGTGDGDNTGTGGTGGSTVGGVVKYTGDSVKAGGHVYPHYLQVEYPGSYGNSTIPDAGCGPTSLSMILSGLKGDPTINPQTVVQKIKAYYPDGSYYIPGRGSSYKIFWSDFLKQYGVTSQLSPTNAQALNALENGYPVIGHEDGHILAVIPAPDELKAQGYRFYILDSYRGHSGAYKTVNEATAVVQGEFTFVAIIKPL